MFKTKWTYFSAVIYFRQKTLNYRQLRACAVHLPSGRGGVNVSRTDCSWEGLLHESWAACQCSGTGESPASALAAGGEKYGGWIVSMQGLPEDGEGATSTSITAWPCGFLNGSEWESRWDTGDFTASALKERVLTATWRRRMVELLTKYTPETHVVTKYVVTLRIVQPIICHNNYNYNSHRIKSCHQEMYVFLLLIRCSLFCLTLVNQC